MVGDKVLGAWRGLHLGFAFATPPPPFSLERKAQVALEKGIFGYLVIPRHAERYACLPRGGGRV